MHYLTDIFMYIFPYVYLYGVGAPCWNGYPDFQQFLLAYQALSRFIKGILMALIIILIVEGADVPDDDSTQGLNSWDINDDEYDSSRRTDSFETDFNVNNSELDVINS